MWAAVPVALGIAGLTAACSPYAGTSPAASTAAMPGATGTGAVVSQATTGLGTILVDRTGRTVYDFANDTGSRSTCNGGCAQEWRPVAAPAPVPPSVPGVSARLGSTVRTDGSRQLTVAGHPVYTFEGDSGPGQTNGAGITLNGGLWTAVSTTGSPVTASPSNQSSSY
jgi:predicted lipoprotein with Yx(FWY)xxD motif